MTIGTFQQINNRHFSSPVRDFGWFFTGYKLRKEILTLPLPHVLLDPYKTLGNYAPTPPLTQHLVLSPNPTFSPKWEVSVNAEITEGWVGG